MPREFYPSRSLSSKEIPRLRFRPMRVGRVRRCSFFPIIGEAFAIDFQVRVSRDRARGHLRRRFARATTAATRTSKTPRIAPARLVRLRTSKLPFLGVARGASRSSSRRVYSSRIRAVLRERIHFFRPRISFPGGERNDKSYRAFSRGAIEFSFHSITSKEIRASFTPRAVLNTLHSATLLNLICRFQCQREMR